MNLTSWISRFSACRASGASLLARGSAVLGAAALFACGAHAQQVERVGDPATMPDAPSAVLDAQQDDTAHQLEKQTTPTQQTPNGPVSPGGEPKQTKRILYIIPNFRAVSADTHLPPQTVKEKFVSTTQQSFDYSSILFSAILAGVNQAENSTPQFHQGAAGYGRYFWHTFADQTDENYWVQAILPAALHEDSRYYTLQHGNVAHRALYAFDRTLITRKDSGGETFNFSEIVGAGAASGISTTYYPSQDKDWTKTGQRWLQNVIIDGAVYVFQEFWPDVNNAVFHQK